VGRPRQDGPHQQTDGRAKILCYLKALIQFDIELRKGRFKVASIRSLGHAAAVSQLAPVPVRATALLACMNRGGSRSHESPPNAVPSRRYRLEGESAFLVHPMEVIASLLMAPKT
jgi:hypothetical protein